LPAGRSLIFEMTVTTVLDRAVVDMGAQSSNEALVFGQEGRVRADCGRKDFATSTYMSYLYIHALLTDKDTK